MRREWCVLAFCYVTVWLWAAVQLGAFDSLIREMITRGML